MRTTLLVVFASLCIATTSLAGQQPGELCRSYPLGSLLTAVALNGAASTRTFVVGPTLGADSLRAFQKVVFDVEFTHANNGTITFTCLGTATDTTANATRSISTCTLASGVCTLNWAGVIVTPSLTASKAWMHEQGTGGAGVLSCTVAHGGAPNGSDKVTVRGVAVGCL
jgi:hypothetical protein